MDVWVYTRLKDALYIESKLQDMFTTLNINPQVKRLGETGFADVIVTDLKKPKSEKLVNIVNRNNYLCAKIRE